jgi:hypothetical protein
MMPVAIHKNAAPPAEVAALPADLIGPGSWLRFSAPAAHAMVWLPAENPVFLLHWIESAVRGQGSVVMTAVGEWADREGLDGSLLCTAEKASWYQRFGWQIVGGFAGGVIMARAHL